MEKSKQALSLYEDRIQKMLYSQVPSLTDQQHAKVAQIIVSLLMKDHKTIVLNPDHPATILHLVMLPDKENNGIMAYIDEHPECVAEGNNMPEAIASLANSFAIILEDQNSIVALED